MSELAHILNLRELEALARGRLEQMAWDYYASGADDERACAATATRSRATSCTTACSSMSRGASSRPPCSATGSPCR